MDLYKSIVHASEDFLFDRFEFKGGNTQADHRVIFWPGSKPDGLGAYLKGFLLPWQVEKLGAAPISSYSTEHAQIWILQPRQFETDIETSGHNLRLARSRQGAARDLCGQWLLTGKIKGSVSFEFVKAADEDVRGALIGLGLASYGFLQAVRCTDAERKWKFSSVNGSRRIPLKKRIKSEAAAIYTGMNLTRHLTNLPAGIASPASVAKAMAQFFRNRPGVKVSTWDVARLEKERMGLLLGVGRGSADGARLVHLKYGSNSGSGKRPVAFVGKGVTFDTGGLDIKPAKGMRLMKKDMAGAATVAGLCHVVSRLKLKGTYDFYMPLAENAVSERATRPGDVHISRSGHLVEIDNTDAEGRLVMADALDVAVTQKGAAAPESVFDISTLTGSMRAALGIEIAGFFSNDDKLAAQVERASRKCGEAAWRMPLLQRYARDLRSAFADFKNSAATGFAGAITAALFLEKFVRNTPWVHFDVASWAHIPERGFAEGANAQGMQILCEFLLARD